MKILRTRRNVWIGAACAAASGMIALAGVTTPRLAFALDQPTTTPDRLSPAGFLPAPNPDPYCKSMEYFNYFPANVAAIERQDNIAVVEDTAWTNADGTGIAMKFTTVQQSTTVNGQKDAPSGRVPTPVVTYGTDVLNGGLPTIGIIMNGGTGTDVPAIADVELSRPLFYSQWVFTDLDQPFEGFDLTPVWTTSDPLYQRYGMFGPDKGISPAWSFSTATPSTADHAGFYSLRSGNVDGLDLAGRFQVDFYGPITGMRMARYGLGGSGFATGAGCPPIGISKAASTPVWNADTQKFEVSYEIHVVNNLPAQDALDALVADSQANAFESQIVGGSPTQIDETLDSITDVLDLTGFSAAEVTNLSSPDGLTVNQNYDGVTDTNLIVGGDVLKADSSRTIFLDVVYTPDFTEPSWNDCAFETTNQAEVTAVAAGVTVSDLSDAGTDPRPANTNGSGGTDDPTPVGGFGVACNVGLAKQVVAGSTTNNGDGTYTTGYEFTIGNYGTVNLGNIAIDDDLGAAYGDALVSATTTDDQCAPLNESGGLQPSATCQIFMDVVFKPVSGIDEPWLNQATVTATIGTDPGSAAVTSDLSQDGAEPDPDGDGDPTNNTEPTPNQISAQIGLAKRVTDGPINNGDGTYDVSYSLIATNTGFAYLDNVIVNDDLERTFGDSLVDYQVDDGCAASALPRNGDTCEVTVLVTFEPGTQLHWENSADVTANAGGSEVSDISQDGVDPDPDGDGDPGNNSDPTPVDVTTAPAIRIDKTLTTPAIQQILADGTATVEYDLIVTNIGDVQLANVEVSDDLDATFGERLISGNITDDNCVGALLLSSAQDGEPGTCTAHVIALVRPGDDFGPYTNVAAVTALTPDGSAVGADSNAVDVSFVPPNVRTDPPASPLAASRPVTGASSMRSLLAAVAMLAVGMGMVLVTRRRRDPIQN